MSGIIEIRVMIGMSEDLGMRRMLGLDGLLLRLVIGIGGHWIGMTISLIIDRLVMGIIQSTTLIIMRQN